LTGPLSRLLILSAGLGDGRFSLCINVLGVDWQRDPAKTGPAAQRPNVMHRIWLC